MIDAEAAPAKVNLFLHVTGKRDDGYHLLDSLVVFAALEDRIEFTPSGDLTLTLTGPFAPALAAEPDNLVLRAARALASATGLRATGSLTLDKRIPVASGIGGGSADAAAALRLLCRVWNVDLEEPLLHRIAAGLGADIPACLRGQSLRMGGIGERLTPAPALPPCGLVLVNPGVPLATASVFRERAPVFSTDALLPDSWPSPAAMAADLATLTNDLEESAIRLVPVIQDVLRGIANTQGCLLARMSGSGATCFGLFPSGEAAEAASTSLARPGWWTWGGLLSP